MIPLFQQGLHILALGQRGGGGYVADTPGFLAEFMAQAESPKVPQPEVSAEACLMTGMSVTAPAILPAPPTDPIVTGQAPTVTTPSYPVTAADALQKASMEAVKNRMANHPPSDQPLAVAALPRPVPPDTPPHSAPIAADIPPANALAATVQTDASRTPPPTAAPASDPTADAYISAQPLPVPPAAEDSAKAMPPLPELAHKTITPAESAWQTRVLAAEPSKGHPLKKASPDRAIMATVSSNANPADPAATRIGMDSDALIAAVVPKDRALVMTLPSPDSPALPAVSLPTAVGMPDPTPDAKATTVQPAPDQISLQPAPDHNPHASPQAIAPPAAVQRPSLPLSAPPQVIAAPLPDTVAAQLIHHADAAKTGEVDVLLAPEELGHVKFQIQQHADSVRILLSAERPETLDLLRRHADQLLQDLRHSGFAQASLGFGQWGQQQKSPPPPPEPAAPIHTDPAEPWHGTIQTPTAAAAATGHGLNLRL